MAGRWLLAWRLPAAALLVFLSPVQDLFSGDDAAHKFVHRDGHDVPHLPGSECAHRRSKRMTTGNSCAGPTTSSAIRCTCLALPTKPRSWWEAVCADCGTARVLAMKYRHQDSDLLVFAFPGRRAVAPEPAHDTHRGRQVLCTARGGTPGYSVAARRRDVSMVGDIDRQALLRVAGSVKYLQKHGRLAKRRHACAAYQDDRRRVVSHQTRRRADATIRSSSPSNPIPVNRHKMGKSECRGCSPASGLTSRKCNSPSASQRKSTRPASRHPR